MDTTFNHHYECEQLSEIPSLETVPHYYYPGARTDGGKDGLLVKVTSKDGNAWMGTFAFGDIAPKGVSGIFTTPDPTRLCVVAKGEGYLVSVDKPELWERIRVTPIIDVHLFGANKLIVFAQFTRLIAYDAIGLKWKTRRLSWDNLRITEVTDTSIVGEFWHLRTESIARFAVDLATGESQGGLEDEAIALRQQKQLNNNTYAYCIEVAMTKSVSIGVDIWLTTHTHLFDQFEVRYASEFDEIDWISIRMSKGNILGTFTAQDLGTTELLAADTESKEVLIVKDSEFNNNDELEKQLGDAVALILSGEMQNNAGNNKYYPSL